LEQKESNILHGTMKEIALIVGHEPGGGARGEREYNIAIANIMRDTLESQGHKVYIHYHKTKSYGRRQTEMRDAVMEELPHCAVCVELHYNGYHDPSANGHEYLYRGSRKLAEAFRNDFQAEFPWSKARRNSGILHQPTGNGAGFLKKAPAWAVIVEPFFESNEKENEYFTGHQTKLADCYCKSLNHFLK
jgi:N-acetylmuramoyl-L-alanine amidase